MSARSERRFETVELPERHAAAIRERVPVGESQDFLADALPELWAEVRDQKRRPLTPPYVRYHGVEEGELDLEAGIMLSDPPDERGRIERALLPAGEVALVWHEGGYESLGETRKALSQWVEDQGLVPAGPHWEIYWTNAGSTDDASRWRTQLVWPVRRPEVGDPDGG